VDPESVYVPSRWGSEFHALTTDEALGAGSAGPGKTTVLLMDPLIQAKVEDDRCRNRNHAHKLRWGESTGWALHLRRTTPMLEQTMARSHRIIPVIDPTAEWSSAKNTWTFKSGFRYQFGHCKDINSWEMYFSSEFSHLAFDELVQFDEEQYTQIKLRVRSSDPVLSKMLRIRSMSNPMMHRDEMSGATVRNPHWVRDYFVKPWRAGNKVLVKTLQSPDGIERKWTRIYKPAKLDDNPDKAFVEQYKRSLLNAPQYMKAALLDGDWWVTVGSFFADAWDSRLHVCPAFNIPPDWKRFRSMDWGYKKPGCVHWWAMDTEDNLFCTDEYWFQRRTDREVAEEIEKRETKWGLWKKGRSLLTGPADTQLWEERGQDAKCMADNMNAMGVPWVQADKKSRVGNARRIMTRLKDHENGSTTPGLVFFRQCEHAVEVIPSIGTDPTDPECPQDGGEDHAYDSVAYAVAFASHGRLGVPSHERKDDDDDGYRPKVNRGKYGYGGF